MVTTTPFITMRVIMREDLRAPDLSVSMPFSSTRTASGTSGAVKVFSNKISPSIRTSLISSTPSSLMVACPNNCSSKC